MLVFIAVQGAAIVRRDGKPAALLGVAHIHIIVRHIALLARAHKGVAYPGQGVQHRAAVQPAEGKIPLLGGGQRPVVQHRVGIVAVQNAEVLAHAHVPPHKRRVAGGPPPAQAHVAHVRAVHALRQGLPGHGGHLPGKPRRAELRLGDLRVLVQAKAHLGQGQPHRQQGTAGLQPGGPPDLPEALLPQKHHPVQHRKKGQAHAAVPLPAGEGGRHGIQGHQHAACGQLSPAQAEQPRPVHRRQIGKKEAEGKPEAGVIAAAKAHQRRLGQGRKGKHQRGDHAAGHAPRLRLLRQGRAQGKSRAQQGQRPDEPVIAGVGQPGEPVQRPAAAHKQGGQAGAVLPRPVGAQVPQHAGQEHRAGQPQTAEVGRQRPQCLPDHGFNVVGRPVGPHPQQDVQRQRHRADEQKVKPAQGRAEHADGQQQRAFPPEDLLRAPQHQHQRRGGVGHNGMGDRHGKIAGEGVQPGPHHRAEAPQAHLAAVAHEKQPGQKVLNLHDQAEGQRQFVFRGQQPQQIKGVAEAVPVQGGENVAPQPQGKVIQRQRKLTVGQPRQHLPHVVYKIAEHRVHLGIAVRAPDEIGAAFQKRPGVGQRQGRKAQAVHQPPPPAPHIVCMQKGVLLSIKADERPLILLQKQAISNQIVLL